MAWRLSNEKIKKWTKKEKKKIWANTTVSLLARKRTHSTSGVSERAEWRGKFGKKKKEKANELWQISFLRFHAFSFPFYRRTSFVVVPLYTLVLEHTLYTLSLTCRHTDTILPRVFGILENSRGDFRSSRSGSEIRAAISGALEPVSVYLLF